ncbi:MAG: DUF6434 domain-containing protein [Candidatus Uhrbacteria bacterium]
MIRPTLNNKISLKDFKQYYWLKDELKSFCKNNGINSTGSKIEIAKKVESFLNTGIKKQISSPKIISSDKRDYKNITTETKIGKNYKSTEPLRNFFESIIGKPFKFTVAFQKFCQNNPNKTYQDTIAFWHKNKNIKTKKIAPQFEYNTYIRNFFTANKNKKLSEAIICWKHKKSLPGNNKYNDSDLIVLKNQNPE